MPTVCVFHFGSTQQWKEKETGKVGYFCKLTLACWYSDKCATIVLNQFVVISVPQKSCPRLNKKILTFYCSVSLNVFFRPFWILLLSFPPLISNITISRLSSTVITFHPTHDLIDAHKIFWTKVSPKAWIPISEQ